MTTRHAFPAGIVLAILSLGALAPVHAEPLPGARLAHDVAKGNCLACHAMPTDPAAVTSANIGPPLLSMKARFPDRARLRNQVWDAGRFNPDTVMPPFGRNGVLTDAEIDLIIDYLYTL